MLSTGERTGCVYKPSPLYYYSLASSKTFYMLSVICKVNFLLTLSSKILTPSCSGSLICAKWAVAAVFAMAIGIGQNNRILTIFGIWV